MMAREEDILRVLKQHMDNDPDNSDKSDLLSKLYGAGIPFRSADMSESGSTSERSVFRDNSRDQPTRTDLDASGRHNLSQPYSFPSHIQGIERQIQQPPVGGGNAANIERQMYNDAAARAAFNSKATERRPQSLEGVSKTEIASLTAKLAVLAKDPTFLKKLQNMEKERQSAQAKKDFPTSSSAVVGSGRTFSELENLPATQERKLSDPEIHFGRDEYLFSSRKASSTDHSDSARMPASLNINTDIWDDPGEKDWSQQENSSEDKRHIEDPAKISRGNQDILDLLLSSKRSTNVYGLSEAEENNLNLDQKVSNLFLEEPQKSERQKGTESSDFSVKGFDVAYNTILSFDRGKEQREKSRPSERYVLRSNEDGNHTPRNSDLILKVGSLEAELRHSHDQQMKLAERLKEREEEALKVKTVFQKQNERMNRLEGSLQQAQAMAKKNNLAMKEAEDVVKKLQGIVVQQQDKLKQYDESIKRLHASQLKCACSVQDVENRLKDMEDDNQKVRDCVLESQEIVKKMVVKYDTNMFRLESKMVADVEKNLQQGSFSWTPAFGEALMRCIEDKRMPPYIESPHFQVPESNGYVIVFEAYPCGYGKGRKTHLSVFWRLLPSENDKKLKWPFKGKVTFTLLPVIAEGKPVFFTTRVQSNRKPFQKPILNSEFDVTDGWGSPRFITRERALSPVYFKNNQLEFNVKVELE